MLASLILRYKKLCNIWLRLHPPPTPHPRVHEFLGTIPTCHGGKMHGGKVRKPPHYGCSTHAHVCERQPRGLTSCNSCIKCSSSTTCGSLDSLSIDTLTPSHDTMCPRKSTSFCRKLPFLGESLSPAPCMKSKIPYKLQTAASTITPKIIISSR